MASKPISLTLKSRGKPIARLPDTVSTYLQSSTSDLHHRIAAEAGCSPYRLRLTNADTNALIPNAKDQTVERAGLKTRTVINVKDLGPQIAWRTVFVIEYLGPLLIHPLVYLLRSDRSPSTAQTLSCILITLHFLKRELETLFVHRFSNATMPLPNIFKNSAHYWLLAGANIAYWTYKEPPSLTNPVIISGALALYIFGELGNLQTHLCLRRLRTANGSERGIPKGLGFDLVTCPNYMFETLAWVGMWIMTWNLSTGVFVIIAVAQMAVWAKKKEARYRSEFGSRYAKKRFAMLPGII